MTYFNYHKMITIYKDKNNYMYYYKKNNFDIIDIYCSEQYVKDLLLSIQLDRISKKKAVSSSKEIWEKLIHEYCKFISHIGKHKPEVDDYQAHLLQNGKIKTRFNPRISQNEKKYLFTLHTAITFLKANKGSIDADTLDDVYKRVAKKYKPNAFCIRCNCIFHDSYKFGKIAKYCSTKCIDKDKSNKKGAKKFLNRFNKLSPIIKKTGYTEADKYKRGR